MKYNQNLFFFVFLALCFFLFGWLSHSAYTPIHKITKPSLLDTIKKEKELRVIMLNAPSTYYIGADGPQGFEYDLVKSYTEYLGVELNVTVANTVAEAIKLSKESDFHVLSAALSKTPSRAEKFNFGPSYFEVQQQVICSRNLFKNNLFPRNVESLRGLKIKVGEGTSYSDTVRSLIKDGLEIDITYTTQYSTEELLKQVSMHEVDCTIADSNIYALNLRYYPEMDMAFTISGREQLAWVLADDSLKLEADMYEWLNEYSRRGKMAELKDHYYSNVHYFNYYDYKMLYKRIQHRLPKYQKLFVDAGDKYNLQWELLAAIAYQESHWNPNAKSFTGVRGMMMLTRSTAKLLGIKNRIDPKQSIVGGTRHIKQMIKFVPKEVEGENRLKFALAAYNIGMGHILDAQKLAKRLGYNQNIWSDVKQVLPLLAKKKYYKTLKYGYARGEEPVKYVESIYDYRDILEKQAQGKK